MKTKNEKKKLVFGDDKLWLIYRNPKEAKKKKIEECKSSDSNFPQHPQYKMYHVHQLVLRLCRYCIRLASKLQREGNIEH